MTNFTNYFKIYVIISCHVLLLHFSNAIKNSSPPQTPNCLKDQSSTLLKFRQEFSIKPTFLSFNTSYPKTKTWKVDENCCSWDGVECDGTGHVIGLDLSTSWLHGPLLSNSSLFFLRLLQRLNLAYNDFNGSEIPQRFGQLSALTHLNLTWSNLSGEVSSAISPLESLVLLDLSINEFLPLGSHQTLTRNKGLKSLNLGFLDLSRLRLSFLSEFSSLESLSLKACSLRGEFPREVFHLPQIKSIILSGNSDLDGFLPDFRSGSKLEYLDLSSTNFSGQLPISISHLGCLKFLNLERSNFSGIIPSSIGSLWKLEYLSFSDNNLRGKLPWSFGNLSRVTHLGLSINNFNGQIPATFGNLKSIVTLELDGAGLSGKLPSSLGNLAELEILSLASNRLSGNLPKSIAKLTKLAFLDVSNNSLSGFLPSALFRMSSLYGIVLDDNQFSGPLPIDPNSSTSQLMLISLSGNKLSGEIPRSISGLKNLELLDLGSNQFSGVFEFYTMLSPLPQLIYLFLSGNNLSVKFSREPSTLSNFSYLGLASCNLAEFPGFLATQTGLRFLDLSRNNLSGEIPAATLGNLRSLMALNLSRNALEGKIPETFRNLKELLWADLSRNKLSGQIPRVLASLKSLLYLDVSHNRLSGPIPRSPQFDTFPNSSFAGNKDLCGYPLTKKC